MGILRALKAAVLGRGGANHSIVSPELGETSSASSSPEAFSAAEISIEAPKPRRILFVESEPAKHDRILQHLEQLGPPWSGDFAQSGAEGLKTAASTTYEGIVSAFRLSDMAGLDFLQQASKVSPSSVCLLECSNDDRPTIKLRAGLPPHFLTSPFELEDFRSEIERAFLIERWMAGASIKSLLSRLENLPAVPALYARVMRELRSADPSIETVGKLISQDPALTAKMLQMVNSPVFALGRPLAEAVDAVTFLGAERTKALILMASLSLHGSLTPCEGFSQEQFWQHSLSVATLARNLASRELKNTAVADTSFTAGLLHDIGKLLFASNLPQEYSEVIREAKETGLPWHSIELKAFGVSHAELAASLLGTWGLPMPVLEAIAWHEQPEVSDDPTFSIATVVHAANVLDHEKKGASLQVGAPQFCAPYLERLGLADRLNHWRQLCGCPTRSEELQPAA